MVFGERLVAAVLRLIPRYGEETMNTQSPPPDPMSESAIAGSAEKLRQEFERWIEAVMQRGEQTLDRLGLRSGRPWQPAVEVVETADDVQVFVDVPGVHPQDID